MAAGRLWPTTSGTFTRPRETRITAVEPLATVLPAAGLWLMTVPFAFDEATLLVSTVRPFARSALTAVASLSPTTFGTVTCVAAEVSRVTTERLVTREPVLGCSAKTVPAGSELGRVWTRGTSPALFSRATAAPSRWPTTFGTATTAA